MWSVQVNRPTGVAPPALPPCLDRIFQDIEAALCHLAIDGQRGEKQNSRVECRQEQAVAPAPTGHLRCVLLVAEIDAYGKALDADRRRILELHLRQARAKI